VRIHARIESREEPVCCHGCKAVAEFITGAGLDDYYKYRDQTSARADEPPRPDRWSAYDRPELVERLTRAEANGARSITVLLEGLRCSACSWLADKALHLQSGVLDVSVNPATARARLVWDPAKVRLGDLLRVLEHVGLRPHPLAGEPAEQLAILERRTALKRLAVAGFGMMQVMMFAVPLYIGESSGMDPGIRELLRLRMAFLRRCAAGPEGAQHQHGRARQHRHRARIRGQRLERVARPRRGLLRLRDDVRLLPRARPLRRDDRAPQGRQRSRRARAPRARDRTPHA